ncbi:MAG: nucleotidyltransferase family protein [Actinomycetota bacterium]
MSEALMALPGVRQVATFGLRSDRDSPIAIPHDICGRFLDAVSGQQLTGFAVSATEAGGIRLPRQQVDALLERHREQMILALRLERALLVVSEGFQAADIDLVVLKGPALARAAYPEPSWRPFADLDLLVQTRDWVLAGQILDRCGFTRALPEPRRGFDQRFGKAAVFMDSSGLEVDLHRTLVLGPYGLWMDPDELFRRTAAFQVGGVNLRRLDDTALLIHACVHASLGWSPPFLLPLRDVAQVVGSRLVDWLAFEELMERWRLRAVARHAFRSVGAILDIPLPARAEAFAQRELSRRDRRVLESYGTDRRARGGTAVSSLRAIRGIRGKAAYIRALLFPSRDFLDRRAVGRGSYWRRWLIPVRWVTRSGRRG